MSVALQELGGGGGGNVSGSPGSGEGTRAEAQGAGGVRQGLGALRWLCARGQGTGRRGDPRPRNAAGGWQGWVCALCA